MAIFVVIVYYYNCYNCYTCIVSFPLIAREWSLHVFHLIANAHFKIQIQIQIQI